jgi:hypothetical protein
MYSKSAKNAGFYRKREERRGKEKREKEERKEIER